MKIPEKVKVLGHEYSVVVSDRIRQGMNTTGACSSNLLEIELEESCPESRKAETFLHEIFEAIKYHLDLRDDKFNHETMSQVSEVLFSVIRNNGLDFRNG